MQRKITVIGGGTGTFTVLRGLKHNREFDLSAIVTMTDSGGSAGKLRDEFGILPVGDVRNCLVALSQEDEAEQILRDLFLYRFPEKESSLAGHNFGNLFLTALTDILGNEQEAILAAGEILKIRGKVIPVTTQKANLVAEYANGDVLYGEEAIDEPPSEHDSSSKLVKLWTQPKVEASDLAIEAINSAELIIMGPGDLYTSLLSNVTVIGIAEAIKSAPGKIVFIGNLVSKLGQTSGMAQTDYINELEKYTGRKVDYVVLNSTALPEDIIEKYKSEGSEPIEDDLGVGINLKVIREDLLSNETVVRKSGDKVKRSLLRHDSIKLAKVIEAIINEGKA